MKDRVLALAREAGFPLAAFAGVSPIRREGERHPSALSLTTDIAQVMEGGRCVLMLAMPYRPFETPTDKAWIDAYYPVSNAAHHASRQLAQKIEETLPIRALASPPVFLKPLAMRSGLGAFGRNGLIAAGEYGSRVALAAVLLDAKIDVRDGADMVFSPECANCRACVRACPTGALRGDGSVDYARCVRAQSDSEPLPEAMRPLVGGCLLGCDICQRVCPRNASLTPRPIPAELEKALELSDLLLGRYQPLIPFLGKNYARRQRLAARALLAAANLNRRDLLPLIRPLADCRESEMVARHARWALDRLADRWETNTPRQIPHLSHEQP